MSRPLLHFSQPLHSHPENFLDPEASLGRRKRPTLFTDDPVAFGTFEESWSPPNDFTLRVSPRPINVESYIYRPRLRVIDFTETIRNAESESEQKAIWDEVFFEPEIVPELRTPRPKTRKVSSLQLAGIFTLGIIFASVVSLFGNVQALHEPRPFTDFTPMSVDAQYPELIALLNRGRPEKNLQPVINMTPVRRRLGNSEKALFLVFLRMLDQGERGRKT